MAVPNDSPPVQVSELVHEKQLTPSFSARVLIPAGENLLVGIGTIAIVAVGFAPWAALPVELWLSSGLRVALMVVGLLFIVRFGSDEVRMIVGIVSRERYARQDRAKDAYITRLEHENSTLRAALAKRRNPDDYVPPVTSRPDTPVDDAIGLLNRLKNGVLPRMSERTVVHNLKLLPEDRYKAAILVMRQAGILFDRQGTYLGMMVNGQQVSNASIDAAIVSVKNRGKSEVENE